MRVLSCLVEGDDDDDDDGDGCVMNWNERTARPIPRDLHASAALIRFHSESTRTAHFLTHMTINGLIYTPTSKHQGNSCILLKSQDQTQAPARIQTIFQIHSLESGQTLIAFDVISLQNFVMIHFSVPHLAGVRSFAIHSP
jgi:hypothetical protein